MNIAVLDEDRKDKDIFTHQEIRPMNMLSVVAGLTPFCDMNQSPRNMYQCQMAKQSIATPCHSFQHRTDNKIYRIQNPQAPVSRTNVYDEYELDDYPIGANAIVAVLSYTGYDMEDAMIINKAAYQRGFGHASVYKNELVDFARKEKKGDAPKYIANPLVEDKDHQAMDEDGMQPAKKRFCEELEEDGLPYVPLDTQHDTRRTTRHTLVLTPHHITPAVPRVRGSRRAARSTSRLTAAPASRTCTGTRARRRPSSTRCASSARRARA